jgi:hypothetical protein
MCVIERTRANTFFQTRGWVQGDCKQEVVEVQLWSDCKTFKGASKLGCCNGELSLWGHFLLVVWSIFNFLRKLCELVKIVVTTLLAQSLIPTHQFFQEPKTITQLAKFKPCKNPKLIIRDGKSYHKKKLTMLSNNAFLIKIRVIGCFLMP